MFDVKQRYKFLFFMSCRDIRYIVNYKYNRVSYNIYIYITNVQNMNKSVLFVFVVFENTLQYCHKSYKQ